MAGKVIVIETEIIRSKAWFNLPNHSTKMYLMFLAKRQISFIKKKGGREPVISNNGKIQFSLSEAQRILGKSRPTVMKARDALVEYGFIDIAHPGGAYDGDPALYAISNRWKKYGAPDFEKIVRPKDTRERGFLKHPENIYKQNFG